MWSRCFSALNWGHMFIDLMRRKTILNSSLPLPPAAHLDIIRLAITADSSPLHIPNQPAFTCSNLTIETLEQGVKYVQS